MSFIRSIATFGGFTMISRVTGFLRDMLIASFLGAGTVSDAFLVSFKLPNLFRSLFAEGAFTSAFVPLFSSKLVSSGREESIRFAAKAVSLLTFILIIFVLVFELCMPLVVKVLAPGFASDAEKVALTIALCRITFPFLLFISIVSFQAGILNSFDRFAAPAATPIILNLGIIASGLFSITFLKTPVYGLAWGITLSGIIEVLWLKYFLNKEDLRITPDFDIKKLFKDTEIRTLFKRIAPGIVGAGIYQINMVVDTILVSLVSSGAVSWLYYANRLEQLPLGVIGAAISVALLPLLTRKLKANDLKDAADTQDKAVIYGLMMSLPTAVIFISLADSLVELLFEHGKFTASDTYKTALALKAYAVGLPCYVMVKALMPNFFARGDTTTPVKYSAVVFAANLSLNLILMKPFGHIGIAAATSAAAFVSLYQYIHGLKKRGYWNISAALKQKIIDITCCTVIMGIILTLAQYLLNLILPPKHLGFLFLKLSVIGIIGLATFLISAKIKGVLDITAIIKNLLSKRKRDDKTSIKQA
ncbi:MAG: murein biosynthesis integral membrane protein MurJ [Alphaproteobacteria bacterium]|nr:murein biosynthesis integral membrane protein MurJ [Alphaproteobacteria bacterium]